eukprot:CAMPEP_0182551268 /NCGR_PEP_ID=MMETSP1323-20130603/44289_1 /TAXON_ID=236787 /ORGANISM="Florenciella parvula, Strain RCC1693" /LENGTH=146 /DNA_ID=CAMNT_0024762863 /DNA_START=344 /DNA_END=780 /DNA_ORIENTATION=+
MVALFARQRVCHDVLRERAEHLLLEVVLGPHLLDLVITARILHRERRPDIIAVLPVPEELLVRVGSLVARPLPVQVADDFLEVGRLRLRGRGGGRRRGGRRAVSTRAVLVLPLPHLDSELAQGLSEVPLLTFEEVVLSPDHDEPLL